MDRRRFLKTCGKVATAVLTREQFWGKKKEEMAFKIIEFGATQGNASGPDIGGTALPSSYIATQSTYNVIQQSPLDGFCIFLQKNGGTSRNYNLSDHLWGFDPGGTIQFTLDDVSTFITDLQTRNSLGWGRTKYNFLVVYTNDLFVDWFDYEAIEKVISNLSLCGEVVSLTGLYGLFLDFEHYSAYQFRYSSMTYKSTKTFAEYEARIKECAKRVAHAWLGFKPDMKLFVLKTYYNSIAESNLGEANPYGLLPAWMDGLYEAFAEKEFSPSTMTRGAPSFTIPRSHAQIIVSSTTAQRESDATELTNVHLNYLNGTAYQGDSGYFDRYSTEFGFMHWLTSGPVQPYEVGFDNVTPANNVITPAITKSTLITMSSIVDWVWLFDFPGYTFFGQGNTDINAEYVTAIREARATIGMG